MKKIFTITVEYPDNDVIPSSEVIEVAQECIEQHMERHFGANIMDGDYGRIKVAQSDLCAVYEGLDRYENFLGMVSTMRRLQKEQMTADIDWDNLEYYKAQDKKMFELESMVDKWLEGEAL